MAYGYQDYLREAHHLIDEVSEDEITAVCDALEKAYRAEKRLYVCGNGGSAANASHFAEDMATLMLDEKSERRFSVFALTDPGPLLTALANDRGYEHVFSTQLQIYANAGDVLVSISGSGNSPNVLEATKFAKDHGLLTIGITGYDGGALAKACDVNLHVHSVNMGMLECVHLLLCDFICKELRFRAYGTEHPER